MTTVAVVGAGIAGLAAAWELTGGRDGGADVRVVVLDAAAQVGGKLALGDVDGVRVDLGAESMLARRPEAVDLAREVGLADDLEPPRAIGARIWAGGRLWPLPTGSLMGVPSRPDGLLGLLDADAVAQVAAEPTQRWAALDADVDVASFVAGRVGPQVVDRLVEPLLGGVYAGHATGLSLRATVPALWAAATAGESVVDSARVAAERGSSTRDAVFAGIRGGVGRLPIALAAALGERGVDVRTGTTVRRVERLDGRWRVVSGPTSAEQVLDVDAVVLATPAAPTARLLREHAPQASAELGAVESASVALVTFVLDRSAAAGLDSSGVLVPPGERRYVKAATFSSSKWEWLDAAAGDRVVLRASVGRAGDVTDLQRPDGEVARRVLADLRELPGVTLGEPRAWRLTRWGGGLPQYAVGHVERMSRALADVERLPGLEVAGAVYDGVGIPACVASGRAAAGRLLAHLGATTTGRPPSADS